MTEDIDIWRAAKMLVDRHGDEAPTDANRRAHRKAGGGHFLRGQYRRS